jgi:hypothetical protein
MVEDEVERVRRGKMAVLKQAREAYRTGAVESSPLSGRGAGALSAGRLKELQDAVRSADSDLRTYNAEHPRRQPDEPTPPQTGTDEADPGVR